MARRTARVIETRQGQGIDYARLDITVEEEGRQRRYRLNGSLPDVDPAHFAPGAEISFKRFRSDDPDRSTPKWIMYKVRHPNPMIGRVAAAWLAWKHGGSIPADVAARIAAKLRADAFQQEEDEEEGLRYERGRVDAMVDIGEVFVQGGSVSVTGIPHSAYDRMVGMRLSDIVELPFPTEEVVSRVEGEEGWTQLYYDEPAVPLLARAA